MPEFLTYSRAVELLREVVAEAGEDFVYESPIEPKSRCLYVHDGQPGCIVGHVFHRAGVSVEDLAGVEDWTPLDYEEVRQFCDWADEPARKLLAAVQVQQDDCTPWGEALRRALETGDPDE
jgi:hypothetical protein